MSSIKIPFEYCEEKKGGYSIFGRAQIGNTHLITCCDEFKEIYPNVKEMLELTVRGEKDIIPFLTYDGHVNKSEYKNGKLFYVLLDTETRKVIGFEGLENEVIKTKVARVPQSY